MSRDRLTEHTGKNIGIIEEDPDHSIQYSLDDDVIFSYFEAAEKDEIEDLVRRLNELNQIKLCGNLGMCFNCRNKHVKIEDFTISTHQFGTRNNLAMNLSRS